MGVDFDDPATLRAAFTGADNVYAVPSPTVFDLTGHPPRSAKDWVAEHISLFTTPGA